MKMIFENVNRLFWVSFCLLFAQSISAQNRCATQHISGHSNLGENVEYLPVASRSVIVIPVVVHVVWNSQEENIPDEQIFSQIQVLNEDFRAANIEIAEVPSIFEPLVADVELEFCLATTDPEGNATDGIVRTFTTNSLGIGGSSNIHYTSQGGSDAWDTDKYLNIWVAKFAGGVGGIGSFPGEGPDAEQGIEVNYRQFGTINVEPPYHLGRTCTHEIGHYFNLEHPWGPAFDDCCEDDFVSDTPAACDTYLGECPSFPISSCSGPDMFMNFMFFSNDDCMALFTLGQKARMLAALNNERSGLLTSGGCEVVSTNEPRKASRLKVYNNPSKLTLDFEIVAPLERIWDVELYDVFGRLIFKDFAFPHQSQSISVSETGNGIYFLVVKNEKIIFSEKVILHK